jgi:sugar transferase (PEP-CTERM/EpsH1 system associated)
MSEILFLAHRIPYPPNKGDKIRSWHLLKGLAEQFTVHLGTFIDDPDDWQHVPAVSEICGEVCVRPLNPRLARLRSARGLLQGRPLTLPYYRDGNLLRWVQELASRRQLSGVFVFSSSMAQYAEGIDVGLEGRRVVDLCDIDSDKWRQYALSHGWPASLIYSREARLLEALERCYAGSFDSTLVIAEAEAELLRRIAPASAARVRVVCNGVDTDYFDPQSKYPDPYRPGELPIVFTGAMDYHANIEGVTWFVGDVLPRICAQVPEAHFYIVGSNPTAEVRSLAMSPCVTVTGRVADVRPYLKHAAVAVAPLRIARGLQNKVLEALAMQKQVVTTTAVAQGLSGQMREVLQVTDDAAEMAQRVVALLRAAHCPADEPEARRTVEANYSWHTTVATITGLIASSSTAGTPA